MSTYLVFARDDFERTLECFGEIEAPDDETARTSALRQYESGGHTPAIEMVLVPADAARWVVRPEPAPRGSTGDPATGNAATPTSAAGSGKR